MFDVCMLLVMFFEFTYMVATPLTTGRNKVGMGAESRWEGEVCEVGVDGELSERRRERLQDGRIGSWGWRSHDLIHGLITEVGCYQYHLRP